MANKRMIRAARDCLMKRGGSGMLLETCLQRCKSVGYIVQAEYCITKGTEQCGGLGRQLARFGGS